MNDEKYMYFTERIQNTLLKPEIMKHMKTSGNKNAAEEATLKVEVNKQIEQMMTHE